MAPGDLEDVLATAAARVTPEIQRRLGGFLGGMMRAYLPQTWTFATDRGTASLVVATTGAVSVTSGAPARSDVTIEVPFDRLRSLLASGAGAAATPDSVKVTTHSAKGKAAFDYLRGRFGL